MSNSDRKWYKENRLYPQKCENNWSFGCVNGYLTKGNSLSQTAEASRKTLNKRRVSYKTLGQEIHMRIKFPERYQDNFKITISTEITGMQVCPFSAKHVIDDNHISNACHFSWQEITITNLKLNRSITLLGMVPHVIEHHHYIPDNLSAGDLIDFFEIMPNPSHIKIKSYKWDKSLESESSEESGKNQVHRRNRKHDRPKPKKSHEIKLEETPDDCQCIVS